MTYEQFKKEVLEGVNKLPVQITTLDDEGCVLVEDLIENTLKVAWDVIQKTPPKDEWGRPVGAEQ